MTNPKDLSLPAIAKRIVGIAALERAFLLRSGQVSHRYFDKYRFEGDPMVLRHLAKAMGAMLPPDTKIIAGLEMGGIPLVTAISLETGMPAAFIRKQAKDYGTCRAIEGQDIAGRNVTFIEDVITTGGAVADAYRMARAEEANVLAVVCAIWRGQDAPAIQGVADLPVRPVFTAADLEA